MEEYYALAKELWGKDLWFPCPSDVALDKGGIYYQILQTATVPEWLLTIKEAQKNSIVKVQKILDARDGELQWKIEDR